MAFTGRLGTPNSRFGDIVFGAVDGLGPGTPDFQAHQLTSRRARVLFSQQVNDSALDPGVYLFASLAPPGTAVVPSIASVTFYDETMDSVVVEFDSPLTTGTQYSVTVSSVQTVEGDFVLGATKNFTANVFDPPRALGAFLSKRGYVDVVFDRDVGPYSTAASFTIRDSAGGPSFAMTQAVWSGEGILGTTLRLQLPGGTPTAEAFVISTSGVTDFSLNVSAEEVPLTLVLRSPTPYSLADLRQLQIVDAFVTDVSSDFLRTANVRVFFSCPVENADVELSYSLFALGAHAHVDTVDVVTAPAATDLPTLEALLNNLKSVFNAHLAIDQVHLAPAGADLVTAPSAVDLTTSVNLVNALSDLCYSHLLRPRVHLYSDTVNATVVAAVGPGDLPGAIAAANLVAASYSGHILSEYPLQLSNAYQLPLGAITAYTEETVPDLAMDVSGPLTYYVDVRVLLDVEGPPVRVEATLTSEDLGSSCTPADYTGNMVARPSSAPAVVLSSLAYPDVGVDLRTDRNVSSLADAPLVVIGDDGLEVPTSDSVTSTLPAILWAYNNALEAYRQHIIPGAAGHQVDDGVNIVTVEDFAYLPLGSAISSANNVRLKVMAHMSSAVYHYHADPSFVTAPAASDLESFIALVADLANVLSSHLVRVGPHLYAGYRMVSAPVYDVVRLLAPSVRDGSDSLVRGVLQDSHVYNGLPVVPAPSMTAYREHSRPVEVPFVALAVRPSLASVLPQSGLSFDPVRGPYLEADSVQVFFSKPMREVPVGPVNLPISGGSIQFLGSGWVSPVLASMAVTKMEPIAYSVTASGLTDSAGNEVY